VKTGDNQILRPRKDSKVKPFLSYFIEAIS